MQRSLANINPAILTWARLEQGYYDIDFVSEKLRFKHLRLWEAGEEQPTFSQILKLANLYRRPSAVFYLSEPPATNKEHIDFRSQAHLSGSGISPETRTELRLCESRRRHALELGYGLDLPTQFTLPDISSQSEMEDAVISVRKSLGIVQTEIFSHRDDRQTLQYWIEKLEKSNVLLFQSITLNGWNQSFKEIRGASSYYPEYPWILINSQESPRGKLFTLGHELAHLLLHGGGICTLEENNPNIDLAHKEQFCNQFSASLQIPKEIFEQFKNKHKLQFGNKEQLDNAITKIKKYFHVSREAAAQKIADLWTRN